MKKIINFQILKKRQRAIRDQIPEIIALRIHRSTSWIGRAEKCQNDYDAQFIFLWIAFNAAYADANNSQITNISERASILHYFSKIISYDHKHKKIIYNILWERFSGPIRTLMNNYYIFAPFWQYHHGIIGYDDWEKQFNISLKSFNSAFQNGDEVKILTFVFERLYILRNQIIHGGTTWNSKINRSQVKDGANILSFLNPNFINIMMDIPCENWGKPFYPIISP